MRKLHLVGFTSDRKGLIFSARRGSKSGSFLVAVEDSLLESLAAEQRRRNGVDVEPSPADAVGPAGESKSAGRPQSTLTPREMQARLRAGRTIAEVAAEARVSPDWVARFAVPILAEQAQMVELARSLTFVKPRGGASAEPLGPSVAENLAERGVLLPDDLFDAAWSAFQLHDVVWIVRVRYRSRGRLQEAAWEVDVVSGQLSSRNRLASELGYVEKGRRRRAAARIPVSHESEALAEPPRRRSRPRTGTTVGGRSVASARVGTAAGRQAARRSGTAGSKPVARRPAVSKAGTAKSRAATTSAARKAVTGPATAGSAAARTAGARKAVTRPAAKAKAVPRKVAASRTAARRTAGTASGAGRTAAPKTAATKAAARTAPQARRPSRQAPPGKAATGKAATGKAATGKAATGKAATGKAGTGKAGTGKAGTGKAGTGRAATGRAATGRAGTGRAVVSEAPPTVAGPTSARGGQRQAFTARQGPPVTTAVPPPPRPVPPPRVGTDGTPPPPQGRRTPTDPTSPPDHGPGGLASAEEARRTLNRLASRRVAATRAEAGRLTGDRRAANPPVPSDPAPAPTRQSASRARASEARLTTHDGGTRPVPATRVSPPPRSPIATPPPEASTTAASAPPPEPRPAGRASPGPAPAPAGSGVEDFQIDDLLEPTGSDRSYRARPLIVAERAGRTGDSPRPSRRPSGSGPFSPWPVGTG